MEDLLASMLYKSWNNCFIITKVMRAFSRSAF